MSTAAPTALVAEDEPLLRQRLIRQLGNVWPQLQVVAEARNGREAIETFESAQPDICFLDISMPGANGIEVAQQVGHRAHIVFVTAYDEYAVQAFAEGVLDYLVKPVESERLADCVSRLQQRLAEARPVPSIDAVLQTLLSKLERVQPQDSLRWIRAQTGQTTQLIPVDDVDYFQSDSKYTRVAWRDESGRPLESLVRLPLRQLLNQLEAEQFVQIHRSVIVDLNAASHLQRHDNETGTLHLRGRRETLPVSRGFLGVFRQM
ncbi:LytTR family DNA-binding domain-containing protein [Abyssibacter sp.]|uniref:LytR/AlgR family response regulator transcription factor n=1 Tax=Abyssibacter sp. TaxID=2320200 RepID=UPI0025C4F138|nr:LytTR family DNA-binding domain-containing protein [Abyssibacter sp.]MCK5859300.1 response regulator transcription factor [Abyssibacter sp.]